MKMGVLQIAQAFFSDVKLWGYTGLYCRISGKNDKNHDYGGVDKFIKKNRQ